MELLHNFQGIVALLIIFTVLVVVHEWGHFIVARIFKMPVEDFSIGFGKRLFRIGKLGDTEYNVRMLPLGGFVKIYGMEADEEPLNIAKDKIKGRKNDDPDAGELPMVAENMDAGADANSDPIGFNSRPLYQRMLVIVAGPVMSLLLGYLIFCCMGFTVGVQAPDRRTNRVAIVLPGGEGQHIGLRAGDQIKQIDGRNVTGNDLVYTIHHSIGKPIVLTVVRDNRTILMRAVPRQLRDDMTGKAESSVTVVSPGALSAIGVAPGDDLEVVDTTSMNSIQAAMTALNTVAGKKRDLLVASATREQVISKTIPLDATKGLVLTPYNTGGLDFQTDYGVERLGVVESFKQGTFMTESVFLNLRDLLKHSNKIGESTGGIIKIYQQTQIAARDSFSELVSFAAQISISLAIVNILPIPILDGGHMLAFFIELVRGGRKMTERQQQAFLLTGLAIIGLLLILRTGRDIIDTIHHNVPQ